MASYQYIDSTGVIVADTSDILDTVIGEYQAAFGAGLNPDPSTPQGLLIAAEATARASVIQNNAALANQINPNIAGGVFLDAILALTGLERQQTTPSTLEGVVLTGVPYTPIPAGSQASVGVGGAIFQLISTVILPISGTATGTFQSVDGGPVSCGIGDLDTIVTSVLGWETVSNPDESILGTETQSDAGARQLRAKTLALNNAGITESIISALYVTPGVRSLSFLENVAATTQTINTISLVAHSIWACVDGGTDADVAQTLLDNKDGGCNWNGGTSISVKDKFSGQTYTVKFERPTPVTVYYRVTVKNVGGNVDPIDSVKNAILAFCANTIPGLNGYAVGQSVSPFEAAAAVLEQTTGIYVQKVELSPDNATWQTTEFAIAINELATTNSGEIDVVIA